MCGQIARVYILLPLQIRTGTLNKTLKLSKPHALAYEMEVMLITVTYSGGNLRVTQAGMGAGTECSVNAG